MDSLEAFAKGEANHGKDLMVFDWCKAAEIIKETGAKQASAGLCSDWEWTGGEILKDGLPVFDSYTYLASTWATPELQLSECDNPSNDYNLRSCFVMKSNTTWHSDTKWPLEALEILGFRRSSEQGQKDTNGI